MQLKTIESFKKAGILRILIRLVFAVVVMAGGFFLLQFSSFAGGNGLQLTLQIFREGKFALLNSLTVGILFALLWVLAGRMWVAGMLTGLLCGGLAIANYFVIKFHTMPLSFMVLRNFKTAMNVVSSYEFTLEPSVVFLCIGTAGLAGLSLALGYFLPETPPKGRGLWLRNGLLVLTGCAVFCWGYLGDSPVKPKHVLGWSWEEAYLQYGYAACTVESYFQSVNVVSKPAGYTQEKTDRIVPENIAPENNARPDIILILNETFYDLAQVTDLNTDVPYFSGIDAMDNLLRGYAVVPGSGGGTNSTEYELLTSNSLQLMPGITPFNALDLSGAASIVSHLNALGYSTLGAHSEPALNYSRGFAYPALGFQRSLFEPDYRDAEYYHNRFFETDRSVYRNLIRWYEEAPEDSPRFLYQLTIQNHGAWNSNPPEADLVHTSRDYGEYTQQINEFLTGLQQSDEAFVELAAYFATVDRPVILCMTGDHAPIFAADVADDRYSKDQVALGTRKVPLLIWANFPLEEQDLGTMSMNMVVPTLLDIAGVKLSPYYSYLLQVREQVPIVSSYNTYFDREGTLYRYDSDAGSPYETLVDQYFALEYQNIVTDRNRELYQPFRD